MKLVQDIIDAKERNLQWLTLVATAIFATIVLIQIINFEAV